MKAMLQSHRKQNLFLAPIAALALLALAPFLKSTAVACGSYGSYGEDYTAHEWGTFTSIQGGDGELLAWNGVATSDLPPFVYDWSRPGLQRFSSYSFAKIGVPARQRMETPVIYFYTKKKLTLDVAVQFPKGQITEWFPQAVDVGPSFQSPGRVLAAIDNAATRAGVNSNPTLATRFSEPPMTNSIIRWNDIAVLPTTKNAALAKQLPAARESSHYFAARTDDAAFVRVNSMDPTNTAPEIEKFLFYRGVGSFPSPLKVTMNDQGTVTVTNTSDAPLKHLFALEFRGGRATVIPLGQLDAGQARTTQLNASTASKPAAAAVTELSRQMAAALELEGLYRAEAEAMVNTWRDAWFEDEGVRVLYILPRTWTDSILPITLTPPPRELVRVMVGRAEVITPAVELQVRNCIEGFRQADPATKQTAVREFRALKLGRFAEVAVRLATGRAADTDFQHGIALIKAAETTEPASTPVTPPARRLAAK
jgi:hypothetical protein